MAADELDPYIRRTYILVLETRAMPASSSPEIEERSTERMNFRVRPRIKDAIQRAAALSGVDDSVFTINAAYRAARETIAAHERTVLQGIDHAAFFAALDAPAAPSDPLRAALARHREATGTP